MASIRRSQEGGRGTEEVEECVQEGDERVSDSGSPSRASGDGEEGCEVEESCEEEGCEDEEEGGARAAGERETKGMDEVNRSSREMSDLGAVMGVAEVATGGRERDW